MFKRVFIFQEGVAIELDVPVVDAIGIDRIPDPRAAVKVRAARTGQA